MLRICLLTTLLLVTCRVSARDSTHVRKNYLGFDVFNLANSIFLSDNGQRYSFQPQVFLGIGLPKHFLLHLHGGYARYQKGGDPLYVTLYDYRSQGWFGSITPMYRVIREPGIRAAIGVKIGLSAVHQKGYFGLKDYPIPVRIPVEENFTTPYFGVCAGVEYLFFDRLSLNAECNVHYVAHKGDVLRAIFVPGAGFSGTTQNQTSLSLRAGVAVRF